MDSPYLCLWFDGQAEEAARYYVSIVPNSELGEVLRYDEASAEASGRPKGSVLTVSFRLNGQEFMALNGGPEFQFSPAMSLVMRCDTQEEIDHLWEKLLDGGEAMECGWLTDRFGVTWQIVPRALMEMLQDADAERTGRVMRAMLQMVKLEIEPLKRAYASA